MTASPRRARDARSTRPEARLLIRGIVEVLVVAQAMQASVVGTVRDESTGRPLHGVVVTMPDLGHSAVTGEDGGYTLSEVAPGPHHIRVESIGYAGRTLHALVPRDGVLRIDVTLRAEPLVLRSVDVMQPRAYGGPQSDVTTRHVGMARTGDDPLLAEYDPLLALAGGIAVASPEAPTGLNIMGGASDQTAWVLDGVPVFSPYHAAGMFGAWNPDALASVELETAPSPAAAPHALSGVVSAAVRPAGERLGVRGGLSTTHGALTADGPVGVGSWLVSGRAGLPDFMAPAEASYLGGSTADLLARLEVPFASGNLSFIAYDNTNELDAAAMVPAGDPGPPGTEGERNGFTWRSRSIGGSWRRDDRLPVTITIWSATSDATTLWHAEPDQVVGLVSGRRDVGLAATVGRGGSYGTTAGIRLERSRTTYELAPNGGSLSLAGETFGTAVLSAFADRRTGIGRTAALETGVTVAAATGDLFVAPRVRATWRPDARLELSAGWWRRNQFAQSVRNAESIVGAVFPVDLWVGAGSPDVPVASSDAGVAAVGYEPSAGVRVVATAYLRSLDGLVLVAPAEGEPFATDSFVTGSGDARGIALEGSARSARFTASARWGWRRVRLSAGASTYVPVHGTAHDVEAGIVYFAGSTASIRLGLSGQLGRRTTPVAGPFEWESCNLLDQGCEFAGSPGHDPAAVGSADLPAYARLDVGFRKHWHVSAFGRDATIGVTGTFTNLLGRANVLTWATDPLTGASTAVEMRPRSPLVAGLDWRF